MNRPFAIVACLVLNVCLLAAGCSNRPATARVDVTITYNGQPVSDMLVTFNSEGSRPAVGRTDAQGKVTGLTTFKPNDGVVPGEYILTLSKPSQVTESIESGDAYAETGSQNLGFPAKYMSTQMSDMKLTVERGKPNQATFELKD